MDERDTGRVEVEREPVVERHTTVVTSGGGDRGSGGLVLVAVVLLIIGLIALWLLFFQGGQDVGDKIDLKVDVEAPDINLPKVDPPTTPAPSN